MGAVENGQTLFSKFTVQWREANMEIATMKEENIMSYEKYIVQLEVTK